MTGYYPRETDRSGYHSLRENDTLGASYDRYLRNGMASVGANDTSRAAGMGAGLAAGMTAGMGAGMAAGMAGYGVDGQRMMGVVGMDSRGMGYGGRPEPPLPPDASSTLYIEGLPANCTRREVSHIFRPFVGFREVRLVNKESRHPGGDPHVLCFVDFDNPAQATIALEALQGETSYICGYGLCSCVDFLILCFVDFKFCMYMFVKFYHACCMSIVCREACFGIGKFLFIPHLT
ncbi:Nuclear speckle RNA-binding protein A [Zea mays]|nr:Nuclear speckle RNA-binding protein A [Zea mays]